MPNLLQETLITLDTLSKTSDDIIFVGSSNLCGSCSWDRFKVLADKNYMYGSDSAAKVDITLIILFKDGSQIKREVSDNFEWWKYVPNFIPPKITTELETLFPEDNY